MINNYASFRLRYLAAATDFIIFSLLVTLGIFYIASQSTLPLAVSALVLVLLFIFNPLFLYQSVIFTHYFQGTLGKLLTGLRVTAENGEKLSFKRIAFRQTIGYSFSWLIFGLGYLSMIKDPNKQTWHDKAVGSIVVVKQKLWPLALICLIVFTSLNIFLATESIKTLIAGPLIKEAKIIMQNMQKQQFNPRQTTPKTPTNVTLI